MPDGTDYSVIWKPQPGPQTALITCPIFEVFYGGPFGGGMQPEGGPLADKLAPYRDQARQLHERFQEMTAGDLLRQPAQGTDDLFGDGATRTREWGQGDRYSPAVAPNAGAMPAGPDGLPTKPPYMNPQAPVGVDQWKMMERARAASAASPQQRAFTDTGGDPREMFARILMDRALTSRR